MPGADPPAQESRPARGPRLAIATVLGLSAMGACGYRFGLSDQLQYLSHYVSLRWPGSLEGDPYLLAFESLGSFLWALLAPIPPAALPAASAAITLLICALSALTLMSLGRAMSRPALGAWGAALVCAAPAMALVVPKEQNYFGLVSLADVELTATLAVLPLVFGSMTLFVRGRVIGALALGVLAVPVHGQTAAYILAAWCAGVVLCDWRDRRRLLLGIAVGLVGLVGVVYVRRLGAVEAGSLEVYERLGRELYAPLIDLWSVPLRSWVALFIVLAFGVCALPGFVREGSRLGGAPRCARERLVMYCVGALAFPLLGGALLGMGVREPLLWRLMVPRSMMLVQIVSVVICAIWASDRTMLSGRERLAGALVLLGLVAWPAPMAGHLVAGALGALIVLLLLGATFARPRSLEARTRSGGPLPLALVALVVVLLGVFGRVSSGSAWLKTSAPDAWREAQAWARENTPEGSVFITPPYLAGWRIGSHRPTFGELRDGGLMFYSGQPALEWERRMRLLGMDTMRAWWWDIKPGTEDGQHRELRVRYDAALQINLGEIRDASGATHMVVETGGGLAGGELIWSNGVLTIFELAPER